MHKKFYMFTACSASIIKGQADTASISNKVGTLMDELSACKLIVSSKIAAHSVNEQSILRNISCKFMRNHDKKGKYRKTRRG